MAALAAHRLDARAFSPTALQHFAACPYRFLLYTVHRLEPREEPVQIELMDPLTRGSLVHDVQFDVLTKLRDEGLLPLAPAGLDRALKIMEDALTEEATSAADALAPAIDRVWDDGLDAIRADLSEWLAARPRRRTAGSPTGSSCRSTSPSAIARTPIRRASTQPVEIPGGLRLRGAIDLVERRADGRLRVTDHKTGKVSAPDGVVVGGGQVLQPSSTRSRRRGSSARRSSRVGSTTARRSAIHGARRAARHPEHGGGDGRRRDRRAGAARRASCRRRPRRTRARGATTGGVRAVRARARRAEARRAPRRARRLRGMR
jgi:hypothetical protein